MYKNVKKYKYISTANEKSLYFFKLSLHTLMRLYILNIVVFKSAAVRFEVCALCSAGYFLLYFFGFRASASSLCLLSWDKIRCPPPWFFAFGVPAMLIRWTIPFLVLTNMKCPFFALKRPTARFQFFGNCCWKFCRHFYFKDELNEMNERWVLI